MTRSETAAMIDRMDALSAGESARLASAMIVPHLTTDGQRAWWDGVYGRMRAVAEQTTTAARNLFTLNGAPISLGTLKDKLSAALGGGFHAD